MCLFGSAVQRLVREEGNGCWTWLGGYARGRPVIEVGFGGQPVSAIKLLYLLVKGGPVRRGQKVIRQCGNSECVRTSHYLFLTSPEQLEYAEKLRRRGEGISSFEEHIAKRRAMAADRVGLEGE